MATVLTTENDQIITTELGQQIVINTPTQNDDIQLFDFSVNLLQAILWEYNAATSLQSLLQSKQDWYTENQTDFWENWITNIFNLTTANEFGLKVWSIILQLPLFVNTPPSDLSQPIFGFDASFYKNFNRGGFGTNTGATANLSLEGKRLALRMRAYQIFSSGTVPEINRFMNYLFANQGTVTLQDGHDMTQTYIFSFPLTAEMRYLFDNFDILPRPAGVGTFYRSLAGKFFGFGPSSNRLNFNNGNFAM